MLVHGAVLVVSISRGCTKAAKQIEEEVVVPVALTRDRERASS